ncbi:MAG: HPr family phosphocarrier protein [Pirellulales bacterium]
MHGRSSGDADVRRKACQRLAPAPWSQFVKLAHKYRCRIEVVKESARSDGRSMLSLLTLAAKCGDEISVEAEGDDAAEAVAALVAMLEAYEDSDESA